MAYTPGNTRSSVSGVKAKQAEIERALKNAFRDGKIAMRAQCDTYPTSDREFRVLDEFLWGTAEILWETNKFRRPTGENFQVFWDVEVCRRDLDLWLAGGKTETADTSGDLPVSTAINQPLNSQGKPSDQSMERAADRSKAADDAEQDSGKTNWSRRGRKKGSGSYDKLDAPLLDEMHELIKMGTPFR